MNKEETIRALENAKKSHLAQMEKIKSALAGQVVENPTAVSKVECDYGQWFYGNKEQLIQVLGTQLYERIDKTHEEWHKEYRKIYDIFFKEKKKGLFSKILGDNKPNTLEVDRAKLYYIELKETTKTLLNITDSAMRRVIALSDSKFQE